MPRFKLTGPYFDGAQLHEKGAIVEIPAKKKPPSCAVKLKGRAAQEEAEDNEAGESQTPSDSNAS